METELERLGELSEVDYARGRKTHRTYLSRTFRTPFGSDAGHPSRYIHKVFDENDAEIQQENWLWTEYELSDRKQIRFQVARESGAVREILIQKVPKNPDKPKLETLLKLNRQQSNQLINLFKALDSIPVEGEKSTRIDDQLLRDIFSDSAALSQAYTEDPERFKELIRSDASANDVIALQHLSLIHI